MQDNQVPESGRRLPQKFHKIALNVIGGIVLGRKQIAAPGVMAAGTHRTPDNAAEFAADKNSFF
jgi:hypothetical protein